MNVSTAAPQGRASLLVNLGSPDSPAVPDIRRYLNQFLMDPCVIDLPWPLRRLLVSGCILPFRPARSATAWRSIWKEGEGFPLKAISQRLTEAVAARAQQPVRLAMRYGQPAMEQVILELAALKEVDEILLFPMYAHYAMSSVGSCIEEARRIFRRHNLRQRLLVHPLFYRHPDYIKALLTGAQPFLDQLKRGEHDYLLFSYHGVPERHIRKDDSTGSHCLTAGCCERPSAAHERCYRHQLYTTTRLFVAAAGLTDDQWGLSFQSRLGKDKWLEPSTVQMMNELADKGVKNLLVICPGFTVDCLETLEEIRTEGRASFIARGGKALTQIPCLNDAEHWAALLAQWINSYPSMNGAATCNASDACASVF
ncbi:MAG: ferrochelatase [Kistimonas sp.]|nr:ferrochelatase [Kistimonas sp.]